MLAFSAAGQPTLQVYLLVVLNRLAELVRWAMWWAL